MNLAWAIVSASIEEGCKAPLVSSTSKVCTGNKKRSTFKMLPYTLLRLDLKVFVWHGSAIQELQAGNQPHSLRRQLQ
jgi:hypothetical protein